MSAQRDILKMGVYVKLVCLTAINVQAILYAYHAQVAIS
jgi:hypothetical protein